MIDSSCSFSLNETDFFLLDSSLNLILWAELIIIIVYSMDEVQPFQRHSDTDPDFLLNLKLFRSSNLCRMSSFIL